MTTIRSTTKQTITREDVERVARIYHSSHDAAVALDINPRSMSRLFKKFDITPPWWKKRKGRGR